MMQIEYPDNVHIIRGNHEAADINALFGFRIECIERMVCNYIHMKCRFFEGDMEVEVIICCWTYIGRERWDLGMDAIQSTFQLSSTRGTH